MEWPFINAVLVNLLSIVQDECLIIFVPVFLNADWFIAMLLDIYALETVTLLCIVFRMLLLTWWMRLISVLCFLLCLFSLLLGYSMPSFFTSKEILIFS